MKRPPRCSAGIVLIAMAVRPTCAQSSPEALASGVSERWSAESQVDFEKLFPFDEGRRVFTEFPHRLRGLADVIRKNSGGAVILLSGVPSVPNSGDATLLGSGYSGVYQARPHGGTWKLEAPIPFDELASLISHRIRVKIHVGEGIVVKDRMHVVVKGARGFGAYLNYRAKIEGIRSANGDLHYLFGGGLLWVDLPAGEGDVTLRYSLDAPTDCKDSNSGCFLKSSGHMRNQYFWHPSFGIRSTGDWATFDVEVRIPAEYRVSTSLPQTEVVEADERTIRGRSPQRAYALTLVYDHDWEVQHSRCSAVSLDIMMAPKTEPGAPAAGAEFCSVFGLLSRRFGRPPGDSFSVIQARSWQDNPGWRFTSNTTVVAAGTPGVMSLGAPVFRALLGHEIAHLWSEGVAGPAATFLSEGWAVWAESPIVETQFGAQSVRQFWKSLAEMYFASFDGKGSLLEDRRNAGIAYFKGPWVFRMLEEAIGTDNFDLTMTQYWRAQTLRRQGWEDLADTAQKHSPPGFDARQFLLPWLAGKSVPRLTAEIHGTDVIVHSDAPEFSLPVVLQASTQGGKERRTIWSQGEATHVTFTTVPLEVTLDPDELLLIRR